MPATAVEPELSDPVDELCAFEGRVTGTDAERRAANHLASRLRAIGRRAEVEPIRLQAGWAGAHALHCALGVAGSLLARPTPPLGFALVLFAATSMYLDLHGRRQLVRRLSFRRSSQNVFSAGAGADRGARVILCANYDAPRAGAAFSEPLRGLWGTLTARLPRVGPFRVLFWALALLLPPLGLRMAGLESGALDLVQIPSTIALLIGAFLLAEAELAVPGPGANDNASGVAAVLAAAERLDADPPEHLRVDVLLTGGGQALGAGMRAWLRDNRSELRDSRPWFVTLNAVGSGPLRYETAAGWVLEVPMDQRLVELSEAIAVAVADADGLPKATPWRSAAGGENLLAALRGYPAIGISRRDEHGLSSRSRSAGDVASEVDPRAIASAAAFVVELVHQLDRDRARAATAPGP